MSNDKGTAQKLKQLVLDHAEYDFEGFTWLQCNLEILGENLGVHKNTIRNALTKPPFRYIEKNTDEGAKRLLVRIGEGMCETDHVFVLRAIWRKGLVYYNAALEEQLTFKVLTLKNMGAEKALYERLLHRINSAHEGAKELDTLKAGGKVSLQVTPVQMGQLRGVVQALGEDAPNTVSCLLTYDGWLTFMAYLKAENRTARHYHWPELGEIMRNPDIALSTYLDILQASAKIDLKETARLTAKIEQLTPKKAA
ncbi:MAG: hypothetical protein DI533_10305 [Cereibacter sphaeroides]|uniref:Uncharacterized protein n=1 Tax=Cereibacter sphaeroides TaxID=1063 RepID=A0A2W5UI43_CERSP|nr:MAG: hypothetical protein DI533_10305 [Cereibacter sphaeroides]